MLGLLKKGKPPGLGREALLLHPCVRTHTYITVCVASAPVAALGCLDFDGGRDSGVSLLLCWLMKWWREEGETV
jgi:hypothetical protein